MSRGDEGDSEERRKVKLQTHKGDRGTNRQTCTTAYACIASRGKSNQKTKYRPIAVKTSGEKRAGCDVYNLTRPSHCCLSVPSVTVRCLDSVLSRSRTRCDMEREASGWTLDRTIVGTHWLHYRSCYCSSSVACRRSRCAHRQLSAAVTLWCLPLISELGRLGAARG